MFWYKTISRKSLVLISLTPLEIHLTEVHGIHQLIIQKQKTQSSLDTFDHTDCPLAVSD